MQAIRTTLSLIPRPLAVALRILVGLPLALLMVAALVPKVIRARRDSLNLSDAEAMERVSIPTALQDRAVADWTKAEAESAPLIEARDWPAFAALLGTWDAARAKTAAGVSLTSIAMDQLRMALSDGIEPPNACNLEPAYDINPDALKTVLAACAAAPDDHILAAIAARLHIDAGWAARGNGIADAVENPAWAELERQIDKARALVTRFDPVAYDSPLLAEAQFRMCFVLEDGAARLEDAFRDWADLDPTNSMPYRLNSFYLLPRWFGDYAQIEQVARQNAADGSDIWGAAGYALSYLEVLELEDEPLEVLDTAYFLEGVSDWLTHHDHDPHLVCLMLNALHDVATPAYGLFSKEPEELAAKRAELQAGIARIARAHLRAIAPKALPFEPVGLNHIVAEAFRDEIEAGKSLRFSDKGLEVTAAPAA